MTPGSNSKNKGKRSSSMQRLRLGERSTTDRGSGKSSPDDVAWQAHEREMRRMANRVCQKKREKRDGSSRAVGDERLLSDFFSPENSPTTIRYFLQSVLYSNIFGTFFALARFFVVAFRAAVKCVQSSVLRRLIKSRRKETNASRKYLWDVWREL